MEFIAYFLRHVPGLGDWSDYVAETSAQLPEPEGPAAAARRLMHLGAVIAVVFAGVRWVIDLATGHQTMWWLPATLSGVGAIYLLYGARSGRVLAPLVGATSATLAVLAANAVLGGGNSEAAAELLVLAAAWGLAANKARNPWLRRGFRAGFAVLALVLVLLVLAADS